MIHSGPSWIGRGRGSPLVPGGYATGSDGEYIFLNRNLCQSHVCVRPIGAQIGCVLISFSLDTLRSVEAFYTVVAF